jgi:hypothetical protein
MKAEGIGGEREGDFTDNFNVVWVFGLVSYSGALSVRFQGTWLKPGGIGIGLRGG